ncbi:MAG: hypothetical protein RIQ94_114 [Pseudomonadota bacterium]|jgi:hypothetical protein
MKIQLETLNSLAAKIALGLFFGYKVLESYFFSKRKMKILFSDTGEHTWWKKELTRGFRFTRHEIAFEKLSPENVKHYDLIVPLTIPDLKYASVELHNLLINNPIPIPSAESIELCDDKYRFNETLIANGFEEFIPRMTGELDYPYILKKKIDQWGANSYIISDEQQEQILADTLANPEYFRQALIMGRCLYATHILFKNGKIVCSMDVEYTFRVEAPIHGKDDHITYYKLSECPYLDIFSAILTSIGFEGLCCIDYKIVDNRPLIFEINPRFGGSLRKVFFSFLRHIE